MIFRSLSTVSALTEDNIHAKTKQYQSHAKVDITVQQKVPLSVMFLNICLFKKGHLLSGISYNMNTCMIMFTTDLLLQI